MTKPTARLPLRNVAVISDRAMADRCFHTGYLLPADPVEARRAFAGIRYFIDAGNRGRFEPDAVIDFCEANFPLHDFVTPENRICPAVMMVDVEEQRLEAFYYNCGHLLAKVKSFSHSGGKNIVTGDFYRETLQRLFWANKFYVPTEAVAVPAPFWSDTVLAVTLRPSAGSQNRDRILSA